MIIRETAAWLKQFADHGRMPSRKGLSKQRLRFIQSSAVGHILALYKVTFDEAQELAAESFLEISN
jgi:hypothetical protein